MNSQLSSQDFQLDSAKNFHIEENFLLTNDSINKYNPEISEKVFSAVMFLIFEIFGNFLLLCLIIFEKYGMDSQKRTITNQLLTSICCSGILHNIISVPILTIQLIFGFPLGKS